MPMDNLSIDTNKVAHCTFELTGQLMSLLKHLHPSRSWVWRTRRDERFLPVAPLGSTQLSRLNLVRPGGATGSSTA